MSVQGEESYEEACRYNGQMYWEVLGMIFDICDGQKTIDELGKPTTKVTKRRRPQCPRMLIEHMDLAKKVIDVVKQKKPLPGTDKASIQFLPPVIQSGGIYELNDKCTSDDHWFKDDIIIMRFGVEYEEHSMFLIRTLMITPIPNPYLEVNYKFLLQIEEFIIEILRDGVELRQVYRSTYDFVNENRPDLIPHLTESFGIEAAKQKAEDCAICADSKGRAQENMLFNISVGLKDIYDDTLIDKPPHFYALWIGDIVKIERGKKARCISMYEKKPDRVILKKKRFLSSRTT